MFDEYDVVKSTKQLSEKVPKESEGTVLVVFDADPTAYLVEFFGDQNNTLEILTVSEPDIRLHIKNKTK